MSFLSDGKISIEIDPFELSRGYEYQRNLGSARYTSSETIISNYEQWQRHALEKYWSDESRYFLRLVDMTAKLNDAGR